MNSIQIIAAWVAAGGLLISLLAIPLILRRVPPNPFYGVRTKATFSSETDWFRINAIGGRYLAFSGIFILATGFVGFFIPTASLDLYSIAATAISLLAVIIPSVRLCLLKPMNSDHETPV